MGNVRASIHRSVDPVPLDLQAGRVADVRGQDRLTAHISERPLAYTRSREPCDRGRSADYYGVASALGGVKLAQPFGRRWANRIAWENASRDRDLGFATRYVCPMGPVRMTCRLHPACCDGVAARPPSLKSKISKRIFFAL